MPIFLTAFSISIFHVHEIDNEPTVMHEMICPKEISFIISFRINDWVKLLPGLRSKRNPNFQLNFSKFRTGWRMHKADWHEASHLRLENKQSMRKCYLTQFVAVVAWACVGGYEREECLWKCETWLNSQTAQYFIDYHSIVVHRLHHFMPLSLAEINYWHHVLFVCCGDQFAYR